jgi:hypothetical protein
MKKFAIAFCLCAGSILSCGQGMIDGFMRGKNNVTTALSYSHESYDSYYVGDSSVTNPNLGKVTTNSTNLFASYGITSFLDIVVGLPYVSANSSRGYWARQKGFQDFSFYLKGRAMEKDFGAIGKVSIIGAAGFVIPAGDYIPDAPVAIGHHSKNVEARLLFQYRLPVGVFVMGQGGYIKRNNITLDRGSEVSVPDAWDYVVRSGYSYKSYYADVWLNVQDARSGTNIGPGVPFPGNAISYTRAGFNLYAGLPGKNLGISFNMGFTLSGENIGKATRYSGAIVYNFPFLKK